MVRSTENKSVERRKKTLVIIKQIQSQNNLSIRSWCFEMNQMSRKVTSQFPDIDVGGSVPNDNDAICLFCEGMFSIGD